MTDSYNRPQSRIFETTDSFVFNSEENSLDLFQVTITPYQRPMM